MCTLFLETVSSYSESTDDLGSQHATDTTKASKLFEQNIYKDCDLRNTGKENSKVFKLKQKSLLLLRREEEESLSENQKKNLNKDDQGSCQSNDDSVIFLAQDQHDFSIKNPSVETSITINDHVKTTSQTEALKPEVVYMHVNKTVIDRWITHENDNSSSSDQFQKKIINVCDDSYHEIEVKDYQPIDKKNSLSRNAVVVLKDILESVRYTSPEILTKSSAQSSEMMSINERMPFKALTLEKRYSLPVDVVKKATEYSKKANAEEKDVIELDVERINGKEKYVPKMKNKVTKDASEKKEETEIPKLRVEKKDIKGIKNIEKTNSFSENIVDGEIEIERENKTKDLSLFQDIEENKEILYVDWNEQDDWASFTEEEKINVSCTKQKTEKSFSSLNIEGEGVIIRNQCAEIIDCLLKNYQTTEFCMPNRKDDEILLEIDCHGRKVGIKKNTCLEKSPKKVFENEKKTSVNLNKVVEDLINVSKMPKNSENKTSETFRQNAEITSMMTLKPSLMKITETSSSIAEEEMTPLKMSRVFEKFPSEFFSKTVQDTIVNESNSKISQISPNKQSQCKKYFAVNFPENLVHLFNEKTESGIKVDFQSSESSSQKSLESLNLKFEEKSASESEIKAPNTVPKSRKSIDKGNAGVEFVVSEVENLKFPTEQKIQHDILVGSWYLEEENDSIEKIEALDTIEAFKFSEKQVPKMNKELEALLSGRKSKVLKLKEELEPPKSKDEVEALASNEEPEASKSKDLITSKFIDNLEALKSKDEPDSPKSEKNTDAMKSKKEFDFLKFQEKLETLESKGKSDSPKSKKESETLKSQKILFSNVKDELIKSKNICFEARMTSAPPKRFPIVTEFPDERKEEPDFLGLFEDITAEEFYVKLDNNASNLQRNSENELILLGEENTESTENPKKTFNNSYILILNEDKEADKIKRNKPIETIQTRDKKLSVELLNSTNNNENFKESSVKNSPKKKFQPEEKFEKSLVKRIEASSLKKQCLEDQESLESKELSLIESKRRKHGPVITKIEVLQTGILFHNATEKLKANLEKKTKEGKTAEAETSEQEIKLDEKILSNQSLLKFKTNFNSSPVKSKTDLNRLQLRSKLDSNELSVKPKSGLKCLKDALPAFLLNYSSSKEDDDSESIDTDVAMEYNLSGRSFSHIKKDLEDKCKTVETKSDLDLENQSSLKNSVDKDLTIDSVLCDSDSHMAVKEGNSALTKIMYALEEIILALKEKETVDEISRNEKENKKRKIEEIPKNKKIEILKERKKKIKRVKMDIEEENKETKELEGLKKKKKDAKVTETICLSKVKEEKEFTLKSKIPQFNVKELKVQEKFDKKNKVKKGVPAFEKKVEIKKKDFNLDTKDQISEEIPQFDLKTSSRKDLMKSAKKKKGKREKIEKSEIFQVLSKPDKKHISNVQGKKINNKKRKIERQENNIQDYEEKIKYKEREIHKNKTRETFDFKMQEKNADKIVLKKKISKIQGKNNTNFPNLLKQNLHIPYSLAFDKNLEVLPNVFTKRIQMCVPSLSMFDVKQKNVSNIVVENSELQISLSGSTSKFESKPVLKIKKVNECLRELILQRKRKPVSHFLFHKEEKKLKHPKKWNN